MNNNGFCSIYNLVGCQGNSRTFASKILVRDTLLVFLHLFHTLTAVHIHNFRRNKMSNWTPRHSVYLSRILDDVIGTQEMVEIRRDFCKLEDCISYVNSGCSYYFTGSRAEGLDLPGSDNDTMRDINEDHHIVVAEHEFALQRRHREELFLMVIDNVHPAFAMLRCICPAIMPCINDALNSIDDSYFLSSYLFVNNHLHKCGHSNLRVQGPSIEHPKNVLSDTEQDVVFSIYCPFWPNTASEWVSRARSNGWPSKEAINKIVEFGFHLVPIGYPRSDKNMLEWRISFSVAEKFLVWSFNHIQIQMYGLMKLILKEFIKTNCSAENFVLCSYFIKTFLFWKFEETDKTFWRAENFRECLKYLLTEFHKLLGHGILKHYFISSFNLLEVKLTRIAQLELLQLFDMAAEYDIKIIGQCKSLKEVWTKFVERHSHESSCADCSRNLSIVYFLNQTTCMVKKVNHFLREIVYRPGHDRDLECRILDVLDTSAFSPTTSLLYLTVRSCRLVSIVSGCTDLRKSNKYIYGLMQLYNVLGADIATGKIWTAILFLAKADHNMVLRTINKFLSSIPPYCMYHGHRYERDYDTNILYASMFIDTKLNLYQIAKRAWLFHFCVIDRTVIGNLPAALQIEVLNAELNQPVDISPFTCAYYLQLLSYHGLRQFDNRNRAVCHLVEVAETPKQYNCECVQSRAYNVAGHCLLFIGETMRAREMFIKSCEVMANFKGPASNYYNSARYYLQNCF